MANSDRPSGFKPYGVLKHVGEYTASAAIYPGDLVIQESGGRVQACSTGSTIFTSAAIGVAISYASGAASKVLVADDPNQEFACQADDTNVDVLTDMGLNYNVIGTDPNTTYKASRMELDASSGATDSTLTMKLIRLLPQEGNAFGDNADVVVKINNHQRNGGTGTTGV
jgi:hypothetical protein